MPAQLDVYRDWLGIKEPARPLSSYQLLRLKQFEDDTAKIREHYRKMNAHVRKYAAGEFAQQSQDLLNELAKAMLCLTDAQRKREYDAAMGRKTTGEGKRRTLEEILLSQKAIDEAQLAKARNFSKAVGVEVRDALLQQKLARPEVVMPAYAESIGLPFLDLADIQLDETLIPQVPAVLARQHSLAPVMKDRNQLLVASPNPLDPHVEEELRLRFSAPVRTVLCTPAAIHEVITKHYSRDVAAAETAAGQGGAAPTVTVDGQRQPAAPPVADTAEAKKRRRMIALMTLNFTSLAMVLYQILFRPPQAMTTTILTALAVGALAGGAVFGTMTVLKK